MKKRICRLSLAEGKEIYYDRLLKDFPACEVKPWTKIEQFAKEELYEMFGMWEGDVLLAYGFVAMDVHKKHMLMDYFAVNEDYRGQGCGQYFLAHLWEMYPKADGMVFEVEDVAEAENEQEKIVRESRIHFYEKAGLQIYPVHAKVYDAYYQLMFFAREGKMPETEEMIESYKAVYQMMIGAEKMTKYMEITTEKYDL